MSSILKKKGKKKKKKKQENNNNNENEIAPQRHEREGNLNYYSEEIAKNIIEKIISLAISSDFSQNVDKKFNQFCLDIIEKKVNNIVEMIHINKEEDDFGIDNIDINSYIFYYKTDTNIKRYKNIVHKNISDLKNEKVEDNLMTMANIPKDYKTYMNVYNKKIEDCLDKSTIIKNNKYLKKDKLFQYNIDITNKNFWGNIPQPSSSTTDRTTSKFNNFIPRKESQNNEQLLTPSKNKDKQNNKPKLLKKNTKNYKLFKSLSSKRFNESSKGRKDSNYEDENSSNKKKKITKIDLPSFPIENLEIRKESEEILNLRKEKLDLINQKQKELEELKNKNNRIKNNLEKEKKKKKGGKYTFDNEGKLILLKEIKPESLLKEFWNIMSKQKEIKSGKSLEIVNKERIKMEKDAKKFIEYNSEDRPYKLLFRPKIDVSSKDINEINKNDKEKENTNSNKDNKSNNQNQSKKNEEVIDYIEYPIEPSGSNFQIMNPSIGVKIKEKFKIKNGGVNFYEKFHKYSINEFNKTLQDTLILTQNKLRERQNEGYMVSTNPMSNFKKINSIIEEKEMNGLKTIDRKNGIIKNKFFQKTFTSGFHKNKNLMKSNSEIFTSNEKFPILKQILLHEDRNEKLMMMKMKENNNKEIENILGNRKLSSMTRNKNGNKRTMMEERILNKKKYFDVDDFNKRLIMGNAVQERTINRKMVLPKISWRKNDINFNNTMSHFHRTRIKKGNMDDITPKNTNKDNKNKKGMKRVNSVKMIQ